MPDLPSPTQNTAQILQDNVFWFFVCFFKQNIFLGSSPETCIPQGSLCREV